MSEQGETAGAAPTTTPQAQGPMFTKDTLPAEGWQLFRKKVLTKAVRITGSFSTTTREGSVLNTPDGYLAVDTSGMPYPIAADEFSRLYETTPAEEGGLTYEALQAKAGELGSTLDTAMKGNAELKAASDELVKVAEDLTRQLEAMTKDRDSLRLRNEQLAGELVSRAQQPGPDPDIVNMAVVTLVLAFGELAEIMLKYQPDNSMITGVLTRNHSQVLVAAGYAPMDQPMTWAAMYQMAKDTRTMITGPMAPRQPGYILRVAGAAARVLNSRG